MSEKDEYTIVRILKTTEENLDTFIGMYPDIKKARFISFAVEEAILQEFKRRKELAKKQNELIEELKNGQINQEGESTDTTV